MHLFQLSGEEYIYEALVRKADSFSGKRGMIICSQNPQHYMEHCQNAFYDNF